jgi:putative ABC transport system permease protein
MFKTHCKTAIRHLLRRRTSTLIQVTGLSIGLACCALVFLFFRAERAFDKGFDGAKDIYRVTSLFKDGSRAPTAAFPYGSLLQREIPEVVAVSRLDAKRSPCIVKALDDTAAIPYLEQSGFWVDPNFFDLFSFHFLYGERKMALSAPNTIVLSEGVSQSLFHQRYPIGRRVRVGDITYIVSGVFRQDMPNHIDAGFFATNNTAGIREEMARTLDWVADPNYYTYLRLKPGSDPVRVNEELQAYTLRHASADMKRRGEFMTNALQALTDIHLHSDGYYDYFSDKQGNLDYMYMLASIAGAVLLLACINYINLSTAQAIDRAREVGVRRILGAAKRAIRAQFLVETVCLSGLAFVIGLGLALVFLPSFNAFTGQRLSLLNAGGIGLLLWLLPLALVTGLLAGLYPAIYLSSFRPVKVLQGNRGYRRQPGRSAAPSMVAGEALTRKERGTKLLRWSVSDPGALLNVRKVLVVGQFVVATGLMVGTVVIWKQLQYMMEAKTGVDEEQQLVIYLNSPQATINSGYYAQQLQRDPAFRSVAGAVSGMVSGDMNLYPADKSVDDHKGIFLDLVDEHYLPALGLSLVAGKNFTPQVFANTDMHQAVETNDIGRQVILNEEAVKALGYTANNAVGKQLAHVNGGLIYHYTVVGVIKNYHYFSMHAAIGPLALMPVNPRRFGVLIAKVRGSNMATADQVAENKWRALNGDSPYTRDLLSNTFRYDYIRDRREQQMMGSFSVIAILISCLGLLGLITYSVGQKAKEIGIRKIIGAGVGDIVYLFARQYLSLVVVANLVAVPLAWYLMNRWLQGFPYRIGMEWWMFAAAFGVGCVVTLATLSVKTVKAALANPIMALRSQ